MTPLKERHSETEKVYLRGTGHHVRWIRQVPLALQEASLRAQAASRACCHSRAAPATLLTKM